MKKYYFHYIKIPFDAQVLSSNHVLLYSTKFFPLRPKPFNFSRIYFLSNHIENNMTLLLHFSESGISNGDVFNLASSEFLIITNFQTNQIFFQIHALQINKKTMLLKSTPIGLVQKFKKIVGSCKGVLLTPVREPYLQIPMWSK